MKKRSLTLLSAILAAALFTTGAALQVQQQVLAEKLIRLHVVANSDSEADQALKLKVRDAVLAAAAPLTEGTEDPEKALAAAPPALEDAARTCLLENGSADSVRVSLKREKFPTRVYESFALPAGIYRSLRVTIGEGEGHNWWCVVFPAICFRATAADLENAAVSAGFTQEEVRLITEAGQTYELKFKSMELLQRLKDWLFS